MMKLEDEILAAAQERIRRRVIDELTPRVKEIVEEEATVVALRVMGYVNFRNLENRLVIEITSPKDIK